MFKWSLTTSKEGKGSDISSENNVTSVTNNLHFCPFWGVKEKKFNKCKNQSNAT